MTSIKTSDIKVDVLQTSMNYTKLDICQIMLLVSRIGSVESEMNVLSNLTHLSLVEAEMNMVISFLFT